MLIKFTKCIIWTIIKWLLLFSHLILLWICLSKILMNNDFLLHTSDQILHSVTSSIELPPIDQSGSHSDHSNSTTSPAESQSNSLVPVRGSTRASVVPKKFDDYVVSHSTIIFRLLMSILTLNYLLLVMLIWSLWTKYFHS